MRVVPSYIYHIAVYCIAMYDYSPALCFVIAETRSIVILLPVANYIVQSVIIVIARSIMPKCHGGGAGLGHSFCLILTSMT